jgi:hypothetical protein
MQGSVDKMCLNHQNQIMPKGTMFDVVEDRTATQNVPLSKRYGPGEIRRSTFEDWVKSKHAHAVRDREVTQADITAIDEKRTEDPPLAPNTGMHTQEGAESHEMQRRVLQQQQEPLEVVATAPTPAPALAPALAPAPAPAPAPAAAVTQKDSVWVMDPTKIMGSSLEDLNGMIGDRLHPEQRSNFRPYISREDAIAWLSQDFKPTEVVQDPPATGQAVSKTS